MAARSIIQWCGVAWLALFSHDAVCAEPRVADNRYKLELIASEPQIVTPIGMAFDRQGRMLVVESHTHQRPNDYQGPASDRVRMLTDSDGDGRLDRWSTFAEGFRHAMNLMVREDGAVYLVTRHNVVLLRDTDHDGVSDKQDEILRLETADNYPHDGLSGIALAPGGDKLLISLGENHAIAYRLVGSDGQKLAGKDGAGTIFECTLDGRGLRRVAVGFWNPFSLCVVPDGRIFAIDNDPDSSPPCRMVHVVWGGDYGFRNEYGRAGTHPLQAWNGELPGTLPMVCGVGEAPTAVVPYSGGLWVTSWGDHRIDRYHLVPRGASYAANREVIVQGGADFRPTGMAIAPDGSIYFADWVLRDYPVHGRGRIWRLTLPKDEVRKPFPARSHDDVAAQNSASNDPFVRTQRVWKLAQRIDTKESTSALSKSDSLLPDQARLEALEALRLRGRSPIETELSDALKDSSADVRLFAVRWIADERIMALRDEVAKLLEGPQPSSQYYLAVVGAVDWLDHEPSMRGAGIADELLMHELENEHRSPEAHALALTMMTPEHKYLTATRLGKYLQSPSAALRLEAVRTLAMQSDPKRLKLLAEVSRDESQSDEVCAEAIAGLASAEGANRDLLEKLASSDHEVLRHEAARALRLTGLRSATADGKPQANDVAAWKSLLSASGDAAAGRRLFFSPVGPRCSTCHRYGGRGGNVGPDLTKIGRSASREKIITSILQPSQEMAPDYQAWTLVDRDGKTYTGLRLPKPGDDGQEDYADGNGKVFTLASTAIEDRRVANTSIMPENLQATLTTEDLRDLVTFLAGEKPSALDKPK